MPFLISDQVISMCNERQLYALLNIKKYFQATHNITFGMSNLELANRLKWSVPTVVKAVSELEAMGLIAIFDVMSTKKRVGRIFLIPDIFVRVLSHEEEE